MKKQRIAYTVSRKDPLVWIAVILALLAAVGFFLRPRFITQGADDHFDFWMGLFFSVLPGLGAVYFAYQLAVNGKNGFSAWPCPSGCWRRRRSSWPGLL